MSPHATVFPGGETLFGGFGLSFNIHPGAFAELMPPTIATAGVDRFMHHAHLVMTEGDSYRFKEAQEGKGVMLLT